MCITVKEIAFDISHFHTFQTSVTFTLTWDRVIRYTIHHRASLIYLYQQVEFRSNRNNFLGTDRRKDVETVFIRLTQRSQSNMHNNQASSLFYR